MFVSPLQPDCKPCKGKDFVVYAAASPAYTTMDEQTSSEENIAISKFRMHIPCNYPLGIIYSCAHVQNREYTRLFAVALVCNSERGKQTEVNF